MKHVIYFKSRKNLQDTSTWSKELLPSDYTINEIRQVCKIVGFEGYAIVENLGTENQQTIDFKWFV